MNVSGRLTRARMLAIRHAESTWNEVDRWQGWGDPPLTNVGRIQAERACSLLPPRLCVAVSSDLRRAAETAGIMARALGVPHVTDEGLREIDIGDWTGLTSQEIEQRWPGWLADWRAGLIDRPPRGESRTEALSRFTVALGRVSDLCRSREALVCAHGGVLTLLERHLEVFDREPIGHCAGRWLSVGEDAIVARERFRVQPVAGCDRG